MPHRQEARKNFERYQYARDNGHTDFIRKADRCDAYYQGLQWDEGVRKKLEAQGKPVLTINKILSTITTVQGELINSRADVTFRPSQGGDDETARVISKVYRNIVQNNQLEWIEQDVADDGFITSRGFYDVRVVFDDNLFGRIQITSLNPRNVVIDPDASGYDPDEWNEVFVTKWMSPQDIGLLYGKDKAEKLKHRTFSDFMFGYDSIERVPESFGGSQSEPDNNPSNQDPELNRHIRVIERQHWQKRLVRQFLDPKTGDMSTVPENWDDDHVQETADRFQLQIIRRVYRQIRWTVTADDVILHDDWSPYKHFTVVPYFPFFRRGKTMGLVESLIGSQEQLNKTASQELHIINTTANSGWKVKQGSLTNMTAEELEERGSETGLVIEHNAEDPRAIEKIQPNQIPTGIDRVSDKSDSWIKEISGVSDSMRGFDRSDVAAKAIEAKQQQGGTNLQKPFNNLRRTRYLLARRVLALIQAYYTEPRVLRITGERPSDKAEDVPINQEGPTTGEIINDLTMGTYEVVITTRPPRETYDEDQFQEAKNMRLELGVRIPDTTLIELSHLENKEELLEQLGQDSNEREEQARQRQAQIELQKAQAEMQQKQADAQLAQARAQKVVAETRGEVPNDEQAANEVAKQKEMELKRLELQHKSEMERARLEFERWKFEQELEARIAYQEEQLEIQRMKAESGSDGGDTEDNPGAASQQFS